MDRISWTLKQPGIGQQNLPLWQKAWKTAYNLARYNPWDVCGNLVYIGRGVIHELKRRTKPEETLGLEFITLGEVMSGQAMK